MTVYEYTHPLLNEQIQAIGGHYAFTKELRVPLEGKQVLAFAGYALVDSSCCGVGGCGYALVPGFIDQYGVSKTEDGRTVSRLVPIDDEAVRRRLSRILREEHHLQQINFHGP